MRFLNTLLFALAALLAFVTLTVAKPVSTDVDSISAPSVDIGWPPLDHVAQVCCIPGCRSCTSNSCLITGCTYLIPWTSCCALEVSRKRSEDGAAVVYNQMGELVTWVNADQLLDTRHAIGQSGQEIESVAANQVSTRDDDCTGCVIPTYKQYCCSIGCGQCYDALCDNGHCAPFSSCCAVEFSRKRHDRTIEAYNQKGELFQFIDRPKPVETREIDALGGGR
ncbi:hypothetical protein L207DRAFT_539097 [Hyaloscypha variabilis F]|uniref:Uncharacterized protein n=1 Tax=Hyaloscypha variabilis (strain UAMH 11265 / GT02V1 / F) TaxID=1149755 RepID=A0A2J6QSB0_HYAVF|nr:hypothetical protein L207DRAFT_539097 [Hyaloscypha variabilis F]